MTKTLFPQIKIFRFSLFWLILMISCNHDLNKQNIVNLSIDLDETEQVYMSSLFSNIDYIPLETNDSCLLGSPTLKIKITTNYIYTIEPDKVLRFHSNGSFDKVIVKSGRGPDQLIGPQDLGLSDNSIYVLGIFEVAQFDNDGNFIRRVDITRGSESIYCYPNGNILIYHDIPLGIDVSYKACIYDKDFNLLRSFWQNPYTTINGGTGIRIHQNGKKVFLTHQFADTIFDITKENPLPFLKIDFGNDVYFPTSFNKFPHLMDITASNNIWCFSYLHNFSQGNPIIYRLIFNQDQNLTHLVKGDIKNDMDWGLDFAPFQTFNLTNEKALYSRIEPYKILLRAEEIQELNPISNRNDKFLKLATTLNESSNIVLMKCLLK